MKKLIYSVFILVFAFQFSYAQQGSGEQRQRMSPEQRLEQMKEQLGLDDAQAKKISAINAVYDEKLSAFRGKMRDADDSERREMFTSMRAIQKQQSQEILEVLNDEQKVKYNEIQKKREEMMQKRRDERRKSNPRNGAVRPGK